jgi:hypothetical protein
MNGCKLTCGVVRVPVLALIATVAGCAHTPPAPESILDTIEAQRVSRAPASCAEMDAITVCERSTRLSGFDCRCADARALTGAQGYRF